MVRSHTVCRALAMLKSLKLVEHEIVYGLIMQNRALYTLQVFHGGLPEAGLPQDGSSLLTLSASGGVLTAAQSVFHIGVGDENDQAWV